MNINYWHEIEYKLRDEKQKIQLLVNSSMRLHEIEMKRIARLKPTISEAEHINLEKGLRLYMLRVETAK